MQTVYLPAGPPAPPNPPPLHAAASPLSSPAGLEDGREWTYPQLAQRYNMTVDGARGVVRAEVAFLRKEKEKLAHFVE
mgnify:CR=1 FL=1